VLRISGALARGWRNWAREEAAKKQAGTMEKAAQVAYLDLGGIINELI